MVNLLSLLIDSGNMTRARERGSDDVPIELMPCFGLGSALPRYIMTELS